MKKFVRLTAVALAMVLMCMLLVGCQSEKEAEPLVIFTWSDYLPQEVLDAFTAETGIPVEYTYFTQNEEMLTKLQAANGGTYDLVLASDYIIDIAIKEGLVQKLDKNIITNYQYIGEGFKGQFYDPNDEYTVPFAAGTPLIVYDPAKVDIEVTGYNTWWDPSLENSIVVMDSARVVVGMVLKSMGYSLNESDPAILAQAEEKLMQLKPNILALDYDTPHEKIISGECAMAFMFTPQAYWAVTERPELEVVYPVEGMGYGVDSFFIPSQAPTAEAANKFLQFILEGETAAELAMFTQYMCCVETAYDYLPEEYFNEILYIPAEILGETEIVQDVGPEATAIYDEIWTRFKQ